MKIITDVAWREIEIQIQKLKKIDSSNSLSSTFRLTNDELEEIVGTCYRLDKLDDLVVFIINSETRFNQAFNDTLTKNDLFRVERFMNVLVDERVPIKEEISTYVKREYSDPRLQNFVTQALWIAAEDFNYGSLTYKGYFLVSDPKTDE